MNVTCRSTLVVCLAAATPLVAGEPDGLRARLADRGLAFSLTVQADHSTNLAGGLRRGTAFRRPLAVAIDVDAEKLVGWRGARLHAGAQSHAGRDGTAHLVGDAQGFDNVDASRFSQVSEVWLEQVLLDGRLRVKLGKADANADFAFVEHGGEFLSSSAGVSPTIAGLPTYPDPAAGVSVFASGRGGVYAGAGMYDGSTQDGCHGRTGNRGISTFLGAPTSSFAIGEAGVRFDVRGRPGRVAAGAWRHTSTFARADGAARDGASGTYVVFEQQIGGATGLFAQVGLADPEVSEIDRHVSVGAARTGPVAGRDADVVGVMASAVRFGHGWAPAASGGRHETAVEVFYRLQATPWLSVKPDLQLIVNPGGLERPSALVATVRAAVSF